MHSYYRVQSATRTATDLLDPETSWTSHHQGGERYITDPATGEEIADTRCGVSACRSVEDLAQYLAQSGIEWDAEMVLVEMEADLADDDDHDAELGAVLVWPTAVLSATPLDDAFYALVASHLED